MELNKFQAISTNNFSEFKLLKANRDICPIKSKKIRELMSALKNGEFIPPCIVDIENSIIDGQHRILAARELEKLGISVYLIVLIIDPADYKQTSIEIAMALNSKQSSWQNKNFLKSYVTQEKPAYVKFVEFGEFAKKECGLNLSISERKAFLSISTNAAIFNSGEMVITDEDYENGKKSLYEFFTLIDCSLSPMKKSAFLVRAYTTVRHFSNFDFNYLLEYLEYNEVIWPNTGATESTFLSIFKDILQKQ